MASDTRRRSPVLAAAGRAFVFATMSFYGAAGGTLGSQTIGESIAGPAARREPWMVATLWITGGLKALAGVFALALVEPWGRRLPCRLMHALAWIGGGLLLYSVALLVQHGLTAAGVIERASSLSATELRWRACSSGIRSGCWAVSCSPPRHMSMGGAHEQAH